jgi:hypothetical protein
MLHTSQSKSLRSHPHFHCYLHSSFRLFPQRWKSSINIKHLVYLMKEFEILIIFDYRLKSRLHSFLQNFIPIYSPEIRMVFDLMTSFRPKSSLRLTVIINYYTSFCSNPVRRLAKSSENHGFISSGSFNRFFYLITLVACFLHYLYLLVIERGQTDEKFVNKHSLKVVIFPFTRFHQSMLKPYPSFKSISGAKYSIVPQNK